MTTRTFNTPEELMIALLQGEKWRSPNKNFEFDSECVYDSKFPCDRMFRYIGFRDDRPMAKTEWELCDGKTLWHKVEEKAELDLKKEKYASGNYILLFYNSDSWITKYITSWNYTEDIYKLIHKKHKDILDAYLADNNVRIEFRDTNGSMKEFEHISNCLKGNFIDSYNEDFQYRLKPKKKTISLAMFTCQNKNSKDWCNTNIYETLESFIAYFSITKYSNHHEIPNTRYEIEVDDD